VRLVESDELAADLGYLPLALGQAATFIADQNLTCAAYRRLFANAHGLVDVLPEPGELPDDYSRSVAGTFTLSLDAANRVRPVGLAEPLLLLLSLLDPNGIPGTVITTEAVSTYLGDQIGQSGDAEQAWAALANLTRFTLADLIALDNTRSSDGANANHQEARGRVLVHAVVQRVSRDQASPDRTGPAARAAADALTVVWPGVERDVELAQLLRANAPHCAVPLRSNSGCPTAIACCSGSGKA
jgi:hypothetical protein